MPQQLSIPEWNTKAERVKPFPCHLRTITIPEKEQRVVFAEVYWADLTSARAGLFGILRALLGLLFGIRHVVSHALDPGPRPSFACHGRKLLSSLGGLLVLAMRPVLRNVEKPDPGFGFGAHIRLFVGLLFQNRVAQMSWMIASLISRCFSVVLWLLRGPILAINILLIVLLAVSQIVAIHGPRYGENQDGGLLVLAGIGAIAALIAFKVFEWRKLEKTTVSHAFANV